MRAFISALAVAALMWPGRITATECFDAEPARVSGPVCGKVFDITGKPAPNVKLRLLNAQRDAVADVEADSNADFIFSPLAKGDYFLTTTTVGWRSFIGEIKVTSAKAAEACKRPLFVVLGLTNCQGGVSRKKPPHD